MHIKHVVCQHIACLDHLCLCFIGTDRSYLQLYQPVFNILINTHYRIKICHICRRESWHEMRFICTKSGVTLVCGYDSKIFNWIGKYSTICTESSIHRSGYGRHTGYLHSEANMAASSSYTLPVIS